MSEADPRDERLWEAGWEGHTVAQRQRMARLSIGEKLQWLEDAHRLVRQLERARRASAAPAPPHDSGTQSG